MTYGLLLLIVSFAAVASACFVGGLLLRALADEAPSDDVLESTPAPRPWVPSLTVWRRVRGWFGAGPPLLTYRRDARGRFRSVRR